MKPLALPGGEGLRKGWAIRPRLVSQAVASRPESQRLSSLKGLPLPPSGVEPALWLCFYCPLTFSSRTAYLEHNCAPREAPP